MNLVIDSQVIENGSSYTKSNFPQGSPDFSSEKDSVIIVYDKSNKDPCYLHFLQINGDVIMDYVPPTPPSGNHQYVFEVLKGENVNSKNYSFSKRTGFNARRLFPHSEIISRSEFYVTA